jgi:hypothetical protein
MSGHQRFIDYMNSKLTADQILPLQVETAVIVLREFFKDPKYSLDTRKLIIERLLAPTEKQEAARQVETNVSCDGNPIFVDTVMVCFECKLNCCDIDLPYIHTKDNGVVRATWKHPHNPTRPYAASYVDKLALKTELRKTMKAIYLNRKWYPLDETGIGRVIPTRYVNTKHCPRDIFGRILLQTDELSYLSYYASTNLSIE